MNFGNRATVVSRMALAARGSARMAHAAHRVELLAAVAMGIPRCVDILSATPNR